MSGDDFDIEKRRVFLKQMIGAGSALPLAAGLVAPVIVDLAVKEEAAAAPETPGPAPEAASPIAGYICFSPEEAAFVEALVNIMWPADEFTANGVDCGLNIFMDRQLAGDFGRGAKRYSRGPWTSGKPQHGLQIPLTPEQHFKTGVAIANKACTAKFGKPFDQITSAVANAFLSDIAADKVADLRLSLAIWFNELVYPLFTQACFADPIYGGNADKTFWKMI